ncbi:hypothetical protein [Devosia sp. FKR38]|uniref:hypothetical protein n=1 Tax=Devosia sp. FKR38 TaxID=2562312 RepID=UPI0020BEC1A2|nr:hypothetical protein [Devosia sp. FKR38]
MLITSSRLFSALRSALGLAAVTLAATLAVAPAQAYDTQRLRQTSEGQVEFITPSGNIGCIYTPAGGTSFYATVDGKAEIQCDRVEPKYVRAILGGSGAAYFAPADDASCCSLVQKLNYDRVAQLGPFQCLSERKGLTCARADGHGFFLSKALIQAK